jgi:GNAT superfamily N-acetyltransferase
MNDLNARGLCRTYLAYQQLGADTLEGPGCRAIRQDRAPLVHDVNHVQVSGDEDVDPAAVCDFLEAAHSERDFRVVGTTPFSSPAMEARLTHAGFAPNPTLQGLLQGDLAGADPVHFDLRLVVGDADWRLLDHLVREDHIETDAKQGTSIFSEELTRQIQSVRRIAANEIHFFMAWVDGQPVGFFSSWPGEGGVGMVEDLFTLPSHRNLGIARALIHHCVADARSRGAEAVLIGSDPLDTPKEIYAAMGFEPTCVTRKWLRKVPAADHPTKT